MGAVILMIQYGGCKGDHRQILSPSGLINPFDSGGGDVFLLSHPGVEERCKAVQWTKRSIEQACSVRAKAVVLHCGRIEMNAERERL
jgi:hypothetical protein